MQLSRRDRNALLFCVVAVAAILIWNALAPSGSPNGQAALLPLDQAESKRAIAVRTLKRLNTERDEMEPRIAKLAFDLTAAELVPRVVRDLYASADKADVHLFEVKPLHPRPLASGQGARIPLEVRFRAAFQPNVIRFLYYVEDPQNRMVVDRLNITSSEARLSSVDVTARISVFSREANSAAAAEKGEPSDASPNN